MEETDRLLLDILEQWNVYINSSLLSVHQGVTIKQWWQLVRARFSGRLHEMPLIHSIVQNSTVSATTDDTAKRLQVLQIIHKTDPYLLYTPIAEYVRVFYGDPLPILCPGIHLNLLDFLVNHGGDGINNGQPLHKLTGKNRSRSYSKRLWIWWNHNLDTCLYDDFAEDIQTLIPELTDGTPLIHTTVYLSSFCRTNQDIVQRKKIIIQASQNYPFALHQPAPASYIQFPTGASPILNSGVHPDLLKLLIVYGVDISVKDELGETLAHKSLFLTADQFHEIITCLIMTGNQHILATKCKRGNNPLHFAIRFIPDLKIETVSLFVEYALPFGMNFCDLDAHGYSLIMYSCRFQNKCFLDKLIALGFKWKNFEREILKESAIWGNVHALMYFKSMGADINQIVDTTTGNTPLHFAFTQHHANKNLNYTIQSLLRIGAAKSIFKPNFKGETPFSIAHSSCNVSSETKLLLRDYD